MIDEDDIIVEEDSKKERSCSDIALFQHYSNSSGATGNELQRLVKLIKDHSSSTGNNQNQVPSNVYNSGIRVDESQSKNSVSGFQPLSVGHVKGKKTQNSNASEDEYKEKPGSYGSIPGFNSNIGEGLNSVRL